MDAYLLSYIKNCVLLWRHSIDQNIRKETKGNLTWPGDKDFNKYIKDMKQDGTFIDHHFLQQIALNNDHNDIFVNDIIFFANIIFKNLSLK